MKRYIILFLLCTLLFLTAACGVSAEKATVRIGVLKGPTGMGAAQLMEQNEQSLAKNGYVFTVAGAPDVLIAKLITGELDIAALPTNVIAMLYAKNDGAVQALAVNTLGTLYLLERGDLVGSPEDIAGKAIVCMGQGTTVQATVERLLEGSDITYVAEHSEAVAQAVAGRFDLIIVPEPFATSLLRQNIGFRIALDIGALWQEQEMGVLPMGGFAVSKAFAEQNPAAVDAFLEEYTQSVRFANENNNEAAVLIEKYDILQATVAAEAIGRANMVCMVGDDMKNALTAYYTILLEVNSALIGGAMPEDDFYCAP